MIPVVMASLATGVEPDAHGVRSAADTTNTEKLLHVFKESGKTFGFAARVRSSPTALFTELIDFPSKATTNTDEEVLEKATDPKHTEWLNSLKVLKEVAEILWLRRAAIIAAPARAV